ncbi:hypothetical protein KEM56_006685 [Ascosphaera pollenicola]|nr:hypothetical protein KEM56_006685 [Ascosphaera pollenicola]
MNGLKNIQKAFDAANEFLKPVLNKEDIQRSKGGSIIDILSQGCDSTLENDTERRSYVIERALDLLKGIHLAHGDLGDVDQAVEEDKDPTLTDAQRRRTIHALLDLLSIEGIYPSLSPGVGVPLDQRIVSSLPTGVVAKQQPSERHGASQRREDERLLARILDGLDKILRSEEAGIQQLILNRIISDIIAGSAELAFNSTIFTSAQKKHYEFLFYLVINSDSTPTLLSILSSFLQTSPVAWFKHQITSQLSHLPLRSDGVVQTVVFLAHQMAPVLGSQDQAPDSGGPPITVQAIMQTSRVLSSVPLNMTPEAYFANVSPKLLALLDSNDVDLKKTAAYVIGNGILSKKAYGAPKTIGYEIFARPVLDALNGVASQAVQTYLRRFHVDGRPDNAAHKHEYGQQGEISAWTVITESQLYLALHRLYALVMLHPNPVLLRRLVLPAMSPLWGLVCYSRECQQRSWGQTAFNLLQTFFSITAPFSRYETLVQDLLWDGGNHGRWTFAPGEDGGISIRKRPKGEKKDPGYVMDLIDRGDDRINDFLHLLASDPQNDEATAHVFLFASSRWLLDDTRHTPGSGAATFDPSSQSSDLQIMLKQLVSAKLTEKLLDQFKDTLSRQPVRVLDVIQQLIESECRRIESEEHTFFKGPTVSRLSSIVNEKNGVPAEEGGSDTADSLSAACSLLSTILSSPSFSMTDKLRPVLSEIRAKLDAILPKLPSSLTQTATTSSVLLEITLTGKRADTSRLENSPTNKAASKGDELFEQHNLHRRALQNLESDLPPVQAEGLTTLTRLINMNSPILDIPSTFALLLSLLTAPGRADSDDEFRYLNVIKCISHLSSRHPHTVVRQLSEAYADRNEQITLDQRLRIGEALLTTVQSLDKALVGGTAKVLGETMLAVAGRRGTKPKTHKAREDLKAAEAKRPKKDDDELDEEVKTKIDELKKSQGIEDPDAEDPAAAAHSANILEAWARGAAKDEQPDDLRVRASAMSILASAIQTNIAGLGPSIVSPAVEMSLSILNLEPGPESAILRRASIVLLLDGLRALHNARESNIDLGFGFSLASASNPAYDLSSQEDTYEGSVIGNIPTILRTLAFVESREDDPIVKGHARSAIESYEAWFEKSLLWGIGRGSGSGEEPRFTLGDRLAGLSVNPSISSRDHERDGNGRNEFRGPRIEEIE